MKREGARMIPGPQAGGEPPPGATVPNSGLMDL